MKKIIYILNILILFISCEEKHDNQLINKTDFILFAGESIHDRLLYHELNPTIIVKGLRTGTDSNYIFNDSAYLDLNSNGIDDILFKYSSEYHQPNCTCEEIDCCMPWGFSLCWIKCLTNIEIASSDSSRIMPDRLDLGDTIDNRLIWKSGNEINIFAACGMDSPWNVDNCNSFIGFRFISNNDTLYGWIRLNAFMANKIEIYDYVIEKNTSH